MKKINISQSGWKWKKAQPFKLNNLGVSVCMNFLKNVLVSGAIVLCLLSFGCASGSDPKEEAPKQPTSSIKPAKPVLKADDFVVDYALDPLSGEKTGPLRSYKLLIETMIDPEKRAELQEGGLVGETIVFNLPGTGDKGVHYDVALDRAAEIFTNTTHEQSVSAEFVDPGTIALVRIRSLGFPSGQPVGAPIPVIFQPLGNASSLVQGRIYPTLLYSERGEEALAFHAGGRLEKEDIEPLGKEKGQDFSFNEYDQLLYDDEGRSRYNLEDPQEWKAYLEARRQQREKNLEEKGAAFKTATIMLTKGFSLTRETSWNELDREEIRLYLTSDAHDVRAGIIASLEAFSPPLNVFYEQEADPRLLKLIPGTHIESLEKLYDRIRFRAFTFSPRDHLHIVVDDDKGRVLLAGPDQYRRILKDFSFGLQDVRSPTKSNPNPWSPSGDFRFILELDKKEQEITLRWSRFEKGQAQGQGSETLANDVGELLRTLYRLGCSPDDCLHVLLKARDVGRLNAVLNLYPLSREAAGKGGSQNS